MILIMLIPTMFAGLANPRNHFFSRDVVDSSSIKFIVFSDPQYGKLDQKTGTGTGLKWSKDKENTIRSWGQFLKVKFSLN